MIGLPVLPYFLITALLLGLISLPIFASADEPPSNVNQRISTLDGLRGFLALSVFFHHAAIYPLFLSSGVWAAPTARFFANIGPVAVMLFFMITAFLFWSRVLAENGPLKWRKFYIGRIFRIGPLYLFAVCGMLLIIAIGSNGRLFVPMTDLARQILPWLALGATTGPDVNNWGRTELILCGVTWTLRYEWLFYISLFGTAFLVRLGKYQLPAFLIATIGGLCYISLRHHDLMSGSMAVTIFLIGMIVASFATSGAVLKISDRISSALVLGLLAVAALYSSSWSAPPILLAGIAFHMIASGCTIFGLLTLRSSHRLGDISYGIYLLQGLVLYPVMHLPTVKVFALQSTLNYWLAITGCGVLLVIFSALVHALIEDPGIRLGKWVAATVTRKM